MKTKGIVLHKHKIHALQEKRTTMLRVVMKPQPMIDERGMWHWKDCQWMDGGLGFPMSGVEDYSPYLPGDLLFVKETFRIPGTGGIIYKADGEHSKMSFTRSDFWQQGARMKEELSRFYLRTVHVRVERLQDISEDDAVKEGAKDFPLPSHRYAGWDSRWLSGYCSDCKHFDVSTGLVIGPCAGKRDGVEPRFRTKTGCSLGFSLRSDDTYEPARFRFAHLWDGLCSDKNRWKNGWDANPCVWVVAFVPVSKDYIMKKALTA